MKILALDTATEACSVALLVDGHVIAREMEFERGHAEHILPMVDAVLAEGGVALASVDALAFGRGPGGFTGVRLAASVTQGLAFAAELPVVPISDLAAVAQRGFDLELATDRVLVCNDARMQEVYWACFERDRDGGATVAGVERVSPPDAVGLPEHWRARAGCEANASPPIGAIGRGFRAYEALRSKLLTSMDGRPPIVHLISDSILPRAHEIARLAVPEVAAGRAVSPNEAIPVYLRDDVARPQPSRN
jgi:tRNA threonylcarbamoyladenosine biosynthesis protein TsaB